MDGIMIFYWLIIIIYNTRNNEFIYICDDMPSTNILIDQFYFLNLIQLYTPYYIIGKFS